MSTSSLSASIRDVRTLLLSPPPPPQLPRNVAELLTRVAEREQFAPARETIERALPPIGDDSTLSLLRGSTAESHADHWQSLALALAARLVKLQQQQEHAAASASASASAAASFSSTAASVPPTRSPPPPPTPSAPAPAVLLGTLSSASLDGAGLGDCDDDVGGGIGDDADLFVDDDDNNSANANLISGSPKKKVARRRRHHRDAADSSSTNTATSTAVPTVTTRRRVVKKSSVRGISSGNFLATRSSETDDLEPSGVAPVALERFMSFDDDPHWFPVSRSASVTALSSESVSREVSWRDDTVAAHSDAIALLAVSGRPGRAASGALSTTGLSSSAKSIKKSMLGASPPREKSTLLSSSGTPAAPNSSSTNTVSKLRRFGGSQRFGRWLKERDAPVTMHIELRASNVRLHETLAQGPLSSVHRGTIGALSLAVKTYRCMFMTDAERSDIRRNIKLAESLRHVNIMLHIGHEFDTIKHIYSMYIEFLPATLRAQIVQRKTNNQPLTVLATSSIMLQMCDALVFMHQAGVMHRDIKSENVYMTIDATSTSGVVADREVVKLGDFGECCRVLREPSALYATNIGTTEFMAPEMIDIAGVRERHYGEEVDIWSLGMVLFELMALDLPFLEHDRFSLPKVVAAGTRPSFPATVSKQLLDAFQKVFEQCTDRVPGNRPTAVMVQSRMHRIASLSALKTPILSSSSDLRTGSFD